MIESTSASKQEAVMLWQGLIAPVLLGLTLFLGLNHEVQALVEAVIVAVTGVIAAFGVEWRKALPLIGGALSAVFALLAGLGLDLPPQVQVGALAVVSAIVAYYTQSQVTAKLSKSSFRLAG